MLAKILENIGLTREETAIYMDLIESGPTTAGELSKRMGIVRPTVYNYLQKMTDKGAVVRSLRYGVRTFAAQPPQKLDILFDRKLHSLTEGRAKFQQLLPEIERQMASHYHAPRFQLYEGAEGVKHVFKEILLCRDIVTLSFWPVKHMINVLSPEFLAYHNTERIRNNVWIRAVWPYAQAVQIKDFQFMGVGNVFKRHIRISPKNIDATMGYWIYGDKIAFLSSSKELFGYVIESPEMAAMLSSHWEFIFSQSNPLRVPKAQVQPFINNLLREGAITEADIDTDDILE